MESICGCAEDGFDVCPSCGETVCVILNPIREVSSKYSPMSVYYRTPYRCCPRCAPVNEYPNCEGCHRKLRREEKVRPRTAFYAPSGGFRCRLGGRGSCFHECCVPDDDGEECMICALCVDKFFLYTVEAGGIRSFFSAE